MHEVAAGGLGRLGGRPGLVGLQGHGEDHAREHHPRGQGQQGQVLRSRSGRSVGSRRSSGRRLVHGSSGCHQRVLWRSQQGNRTCIPLAAWPGPRGPARCFYRKHSGNPEEMQVGHHTGMDRAPVADWEGHVIVCGLQGVGPADGRAAPPGRGGRGGGGRRARSAPGPGGRGLGDPLHRRAARGSAAVLERAGLAAARAVVCAERTEVQTLETALLISELRPDIRVVVQLANAAVGAAVAQVTGPGHRARRGRAGRTVHRRGLPGQRLVPDRVRPAPGS